MKYDSPADAANLGYVHGLHPNLLYAEELKPRKELSENTIVS